MPKKYEHINCCEKGKIYIKQLMTEVCGLNFFIEGKKLCFITRTPEGVEKRHWVKLSPRVLAAIKSKTDPHIKEKEINSKLTPKELAEKYAEMGGS
jgi:hypothetical protein